MAVLLIATLAGGGRAQARTLFTLTGHGWGHGIGLSQWGADGYAQHGWGYRRILAHYYTGTGLGTLRPGAHERVLMLSRAGDVHVTVAGAAVAAGRRRAHAPDWRRRLPDRAGPEVRRCCGCGARSASA